MQDPVLYPGLCSRLDRLIGYMPEIEDLQNPINRFATQVYSSDGKVFGNLEPEQGEQNRYPYDKMSPHLVEALVATEDERFYEHSGIDFRALGRAIVKRGLMDKPMPEEAPPSPSSWRSSCIARQPAAPCSASSRNP